MNENPLEKQLSLKILEKLSIGIFVLELESRTDKEFRIKYINKSNSSIVGVDLQPFVGKTLRDSFPDAYEHGLPDKYLEALENQSIVKIGEMDYGDDRIEKQIFFLEVIPLDERTVMLTTENISSLKKSEEDLFVERNTLKEKNKELEYLTYIVSHDLKSPLNTVLSYFPILKNKFKTHLDKDTNRMFDFIEESGIRMRELIEHILDFALIGGTRKREVVDFNQLILEIEMDLLSILEKANAKINFKELPVLSVYKIELRQLFQNLIANSLKFKKESVSPVISIDAYQQDGFWVLTFEDNGIGIAEKDQDKIFKVFHKLNGNLEGIGLGLANCKKIIGLHGGEIWVESEVNKGSKFFISIKDKS